MSRLCSGLSAGIYTTNSAEACFHVLSDCEANVVVVENQTQLDKILEVSFFAPKWNQKHQLLQDYVYKNTICCDVIIGVITLCW